MYIPYITQFSQPDSIIPDPYNSLDWNRYSYARYNPVRFTDPSGHCPEEDAACREILSSLLPKPKVPKVTGWRKLWQSLQEWLPSIGPFSPVVAPAPEIQSPFQLPQNATATPQPPTATSQSSGQVTAQVTTIVTATPTSQATPEVPQILYHYTSHEGLAGILTSQTIFPSLGTGPNAYFGEGVYFTDITPAAAAATSPYKLARALAGNPWGYANKMMAYVAVDVAGLDVAWVSAVFSNTYGPASIYLYPTITPLDISDRLVSAGPVPYVSQKP